MNEQHGFIFPYVLFLITIILLLVTVSSNTYKNEIYMAKQYTENLKIQTVYQMGLSKFKEEYATGSFDSASGTISYDFPDGKSVIQYSKMEEELDLKMKIALNDSSLKKTIRRIITLSEWDVYH